MSLDDKLSYKALSYTWGAANDTLPITLNGHRFEVTRNLKRALQRLRAFDAEMPIWIDAICINQVDIIERMHQVQLMRYIFESPVEVIVYLGEPQTHQQTMAQQLQDEMWDRTLFDWAATPSDVRRVNTILKYGQAYADTYPDLPDERTPNPLMLAMCFMRLLAGDVHLRDISLLTNINIQRACLDAFQSIAMQPWVRMVHCLPPRAFCCHLCPHGDVLNFMKILICFSGIEYGAFRKLFSPQRLPSYTADSPLLFRCTSTQPRISSVTYQHVVKKLYHLAKNSPQLYMIIGRRC